MVGADVSRHPGRAAALLLGLLLATGPTAASAHTDLASSAPAAGARVDQLPSVVQLRFSGPVDPNFATVILTPPDARGDGERLVTTAGASASILSAEIDPGQVEAAPAGTWTVGYRVTSTDGHPIQGSVKFEVIQVKPTPSPRGPSESRGPAPSLQEPPAPSAAEQSDGGTLWPYLVLGLGVASVVALGRRFHSRRDQRQDEPRSTS